MSAYGRYQRSRREQDLAFQAWRRRESNDVLLAFTVIGGAFVLVLALVLVTS